MGRNLMSLQKMINSRGPKQDPCAAPCSILKGSEYVVELGFVVTLATNDRSLR